MENIHNTSDVVWESCFENLTLGQIHYTFFPFQFFTCVFCKYFRSGSRFPYSGVW